MADPQPIRASVTAKYYLPKGDEKREIAVACKVTERDRRLMQIIIEDGKTKGLPFKTPSDLVYWGVKNAIRVVADDLKNERFTNLFLQLQQEEELFRQSGIRRKIKRMLNRLHTEVVAYEEEGAQSEIPRLLRAFEKTLVDMERDFPNFWVKKAREQFYDHYGKRLKADRISNSPRNAVKEEE